jgi:diguanylate cyclase (GGDEF)-like protein
MARYTNPTWEQKVRFGQLLEGSNKKLAIGTYENALEDLQHHGKREEALLVLRRIVAMEPTQKNHLRVAELSAQLGEGALAAQHFLQLAEMAATAGGDPQQYIERAYSENPTDPKVAFGYGKTLLARGEAGAAIFIFEPLLRSSQLPEVRELYAQALLTTGRCAEAEPLIWQIFEQNPARVPHVIELIGRMIDSNLDAEAVSLARKLEAFQRRRGERRSFIGIMQELAASHRPSAAMFEFLAELFNAANRESDYMQALVKLFDLYCGENNFPKAADCLDRAMEADLYEPGHQKRLERLRGKIDDHRFKVIEARFSAGKKDGQQKNDEQRHEQTKPQDEPTPGAAALQDLMLQAEILVQYGMRAKAVERLQRIKELYPHEEQKNQSLQKLYISAGLEVQPQPSSTPATTPATVPEFPTPAPVTPKGEPTEAGSLTRVAEITRKLYQQGNTEAVLKTAAQEIGETWRATRCVAALRKPGLPATCVQEFHQKSEAPATPASLATIVEHLQDVASASGPVTTLDAAYSAELIAIQGALEKLHVQSLLVVPLSEGDEQMGVLVLMHGSERAWQASETLMIRAVADQVMIALNNAGLRRLVKNLSVTDEKSGLLKRASYLDLLQAETRRGLQQGSALTILLIQFGYRAALAKDGATAVNHMMDHIGRLLSANMRANDLAFRYDETTVALVLGESEEKQALQAMEKLRSLLKEVRLQGQDKPVDFCAAVAPAVMRQQFDPADIVTEVINRADQALETAIAQGPGRVVSQAPQMAAGAVA